MKKNRSPRKKRAAPKAILRLPDLDHAKAAVLNSLTCPDAQRVYRHAIDEFIGWYCSEPRLSFNKTVVLLYRIHLEFRKLAPGTQHYTYHRALVTNLELTPPAVWRFYCDRAFQELLLRELKDSYALAKIPSRRFCANAAYLETILWAYDLVLAFQTLCLPEKAGHWNISTLRRELWWLPAEWIKRNNRNVLVLPAKYPRQDLFRKIQQATAEVKPLF